MPGLSDLGLKPGWIYEVIATTYTGQMPHAAPLGFSILDGKTCRIEVYKSAHTLANIQAAGEFALNLTRDLALFEAALHARETLAYEQGQRVDAPVLTHADCALELMVSQVEDLENRCRVSATPMHITGVLDAPLLNRAQGLYLESLVLETRVNFLGLKKSGPLLLENHRVISKVAPGSEYEALSKRLLIRQGLADDD